MFHKSEHFPQVRMWYDKNWRVSCQKNPPRIITWRKPQAASQLQFGVLLPGTTSTSQLLSHAFSIQLPNLWKSQAVIRAAAISRQVKRIATGLTKRYIEKTSIPTLTQPENEHDNGTSTIWRCISYWTSGFASVMLAFMGVIGDAPTHSFSLSKSHYFNMAIPKPTRVLWILFPWKAAMSIFYWLPPSTMGGKIQEVTGNPTFWNRVDFPCCLKRRKWLLSDDRNVVSTGNTSGIPSSLDHHFLVEILFCG